MSKFKNLDSVDILKNNKAMDDFIEELNVELIAMPNYNFEEVEVNLYFDREQRKIKAKIIATFIYSHENQSIKETFGVCDSFDILDIESIAKHLCYLAGGALEELESRDWEGSPHDEFDDFKIKREESL